MKRIAAFALPLFLLTAACASSPNWSGAETEAGAFVWAPSPGPRFWINAVLLGGVIAYFASGIIQAVRQREKGGGGTGCLSVLLLFFAFLLYVNIRDFIWYESYSIGRDGIAHSYYTNVWKTAGKTDRLGWNEIDYIGYSPEAILDSTTWVRVFRSTGKRVDPTGGGTEEGTKGRVIYFGAGEKGIKLVLAKEYFDTSRPEWMGTAWGWVFGNEDFEASAREEARLKAAISRLMPETLKDRMSPQASEYFRVPPK